ncbi:phosphate ABC transporter substrate-binding/OmpA family protein [Harenicola maris]|uniref:phosphate ABC transporter substrate-binding/OmpA family protein n=1 Tax=Harenicola maris TaxID=2841044 RepID=UPI002E19B85A
MSLTAAFGQDILLTSRDGSITVEGNLLSYDGEFYRLDTDYGVLTVDGQGVVCSGPGCPDLTAYVAQLRISGARTMGEVLLPALVEAYAVARDLRVKRAVSDDTHFEYKMTTRLDDRLVARIQFRVSNSDEGFADLVAEEADLAMTVREPLTEEVRRGIEAGIGDLSAPRRARIVALDGLVPIVAQNNPLRRLTLEELAGILSGEIADWSAFGQAENAIELHGQLPTSGVQQGAEARILAGDTHRAMTRHASNAELSDAVARSPFAIGVTSFSEVGNASVVLIDGPCGRAIAPGRLSLKAEDYPLATPLFLYTPARRLPLFAREFLNWLTSPAAQLVVQRSGFVNQSPERIPLAAQGDRLAAAIMNAGEGVPLPEVQRMISDLSEAARLTTTFRFRGGSARMDTQSEGNVDLLARALEAGVYDDRTLIFAGFSDGQGPADGNKRISRQRAEAAWQAVKKEARTADWSRVTVRSIGFGEALPMGCDDVEWGRQINRRVEVWLQ